MASVSGRGAGEEDTESMGHAIGHWLEETVPGIEDW
jgi:hypothetical protein